jgi:hypothetical protein
MSVKKAPIVHVTFWDHAMNTGDEIAPVECHAFGVLYKEDDRAYYVSSWIAHNDPNDSNSESYVIIKHPGVKIKRLK